MTFTANVGMCQRVNGVLTLPSLNRSSTRTSPPARDSGLACRDLSRGGLAGACFAVRSRTAGRYDAVVRADGRENCAVGGGTGLAAGCAGTAFQRRVAGPAALAGRAGGRGGGAAGW